MSVVTAADVRSAVIELVAALIDYGSGPGALQFQALDDTPIATLTFSSPPFAESVDGVATANAITDGVAVSGGTISKAVIMDSADTPVFTCSVGPAGSGEDIELNTVMVLEGQVVSIALLTYEAPQ